MALFNNKKLSKLKEENEELRQRFQQISEKEQRTKHLDEVLRRLRTDIHSANNEKKQIHEQIEEMGEQELRKREEVAVINNRIVELNQLKDELQDNIIRYSTKVQELEEEIRQKEGNGENFGFEQGYMDNNVLEGLKLQREELERNLDELKQRTAELQEEEGELGKRIEEKRELLAELNINSDEGKKESAEVESSIDELEEQLDKKKYAASETEKAVKILLAKEKELENKVGILETEYSKKKEELKLAEENISAIIGAKASVENEINQMRELLAGKREEMREIEEREGLLVGGQEQIAKNIIATEAEYRALSAKKESLQALLDDMTFQVRDKEEQLNDIAVNAKSVDIEYGEAFEKIASLKKEAEEYTSKLQALAEAEKFKLMKIAEIDKNSSTRESSFMLLTAKVSDLEGAIAEQKSLLSETTTEYNKLVEESEYKQKELYAIDQTLSIKANRLNGINLQLLELEKRVDEIMVEITAKEILLKELEDKSEQKKSEIAKAEEDQQKFGEIIPLLEKRQKEIEKENSTLEEKFFIMFQKINQDLGALNKKRSVLEQMLLKKEKDIEEKDQQLFEKLASLEETERVLTLHQAEIESVENMITGLNDQKEIVKGELLKLEEESVDRRNYSTDLKLESDLLLQKKGMIEKTLQDLLNFMNEGFGKAKERKGKVEKDVAMNEEQLQIIKNKIAEAMKELGEVQGAVATVQTEYEEYRSNVTKLMAIKKKLQGEIAKHQSVLQKFQKIKEKLKIEHSAALKRLEVGKETEVKNAQIYNIKQQNQ